MAGERSDVAYGGHRYSRSTLARVSRVAGYSVVLWQVRFDPRQKVSLQPEAEPVFGSRASPSQAAPDGAAVNIKVRPP